MDVGSALLSIECRVPHMDALQFGAGSAPWHRPKNQGRVPESAMYRFNKLERPLCLQLDACRSGGLIPTFASPDMSAEQMSESKRPLVIRLSHCADKSGEQFSLRIDMELAVYVASMDAYGSA